MKTTLVVPSIAKDIPKLLANIDTYFAYLPIDEICVIGSEDVRALLPELNDRLRFLAETEIVDFQKIKALIAKRAGENAAKRTGWYVQQFIKMGFSLRTEEEYYLLWDSDTLPVKKVKLFSDEGIPYLDCKTECHKPYFVTIQRLFPDIRKERKESFIAEHMLINTKLMRKLIAEIEANESLQGDSFDEKIISAVDPKDLGGSGFSEFETYGSYVCKYEPASYEIRHWKSLRNAAFFFDAQIPLTERNVSWLAKKYDAVSFEKGDDLSVLSKLIQSGWYVRVFSARSLEKLAFFIKAVRKICGKR